jgi:RNA polymerase sigma-70 factor, ECF subfamily
MERSLLPISSAGHVPHDPRVHPVTVLTRAEAPDLALIERFRSGEQAAFATLVRRHLRRLYRIARSILPSHTSALAAVEEALLRAHASLADAGSEGSVSAWLSRLTFNTARTRRRELPGAASVSEAAEGPAAQAQQVIERVPEVFRTVLVLRTLERLRGVDVAASLGLHTTTVRTRLFRAQRRLTAQELETLHTAAPMILAPDSGEIDQLIARVLARAEAGQPAR